jgi:hypothetical protein
MNLFTRHSPYYHLLNIYYYSWNTLYTYIYIHTHIYIYTYITHIHTYITHIPKMFGYSVFYAVSILIQLCTRNSSTAGEIVTPLWLGTYIMTLANDVMLVFFILVSAVHNQIVTAASYCHDLVLLELDGDTFFTINIRSIPSWDRNCGISGKSPQV